MPLSWQDGGAGVGEVIANSYSEYCPGDRVSEGVLRVDGGGGLCRQILFGYGGGL